MRKQTRKKGQAASVPAGLAWAEATGMAMTIGLSALMSVLLSRGTIQMEHTGYGVMMILFMTALAVTVISGQKIKHRIVFIGYLSCGLYFILLLAMTALFFGGQYAAVGETGIMIAAGGTAGIALEMIPRKRSKFSKYH